MPVYVMCCVEESRAIGWLNDWIRGPPERIKRRTVGWILRAGPYTVVWSCGPQMRPTVRHELYLWWGLNRLDRLGTIQYDLCDKSIFVLLSQYLVS